MAHPLRFTHLRLEFTIHFSQHNPAGHPMFTVDLNNQPIRVILISEQQLVLELPHPGVSHLNERLADTAWRVSPAGTVVHTGRRFLDPTLGDDLNQTLTYVIAKYTQYVKAVYLLD